MFESMICRPTHNTNWGGKNKRARTNMSFLVAHKTAGGEKYYFCWSTPPNGGDSSPSLVCRTQP